MGTGPAGPRFSSSSPGPVGYGGAIRQPRRIEGRRRCAAAVSQEGRESVTVAVCGSCSVVVVVLIVTFRTDVLLWGEAGR
ncbi:Hypothetical protein SCLAV_p1557 (plasmid) [Streptomyces clavuligerus]|uniref:Uncharacterized protein n=1 Tax=Streptomyces clavuligerus TaxID=1901 RepID=D5SM95_STRCL|nr:Hypothetical protein SCLAV_p1557 [Streptomyces clavuligerus]